MGIVLFRKLRNEVLNTFAVFFHLLISLIVIIQLNYMIGILADELALGGDAFSMLIGFVTVVFNFTSLLLCSEKVSLHKRKNAS